MVARFLQAPVGGGGGFGSWVAAWHMRHARLEKSSVWSVISFCVFCFIIFSDFYLSFHQHDGSPAAER